MSRNELASFYQNAKREVQQAIFNVKNCEDKLDAYFSTVNRQIKENPRAQKENFKKAVKQFNVISEFFFAINLELLEISDSDKNENLEELEDVRKIPALLPSKDHHVPVKEPLHISDFSNRNEVSSAADSPTFSEIDTFGKSSKFLTNNNIEKVKDCSESVTETPPQTPKKQVVHESPIPIRQNVPLRRPKEAIRVEAAPPKKPEPVVPQKETLIPYRQVDISKFKTDYKFKGYISHIQLSAFGLVFVCEVNSENFKAINTLATDFKKNPSSYPPMTQDPESNTVFGIVLEGIFIRAVRQITPNCDQIYLVDSGEILLFSNEHSFFKLPEKFQKFPGLAFFAQIFSYKGSTDFDVEEVLEKYEFCSYDFTVVSTEDEFICLDVGGFKVLPGFNTDPEPVSEMVVTDSQRKILMEEPLNTTNAMKAVTGYNPRDDKNLCKFTSPITGKAIPKIPKPDVNTKIKVVPLQIVEPNRIYCHLIIDDGKAFENMSKELGMAVKYNVVNNFEGDEEPKVMELVFAQYSEDSCWYRAVVLNKYDDGNFKVFFVDFGNMETVPIQDLRKWNNRFEIVPFQAILCRLYGVNAIEEARSSATEFLESEIIEKYMNAIVIDNNNELVIDLLLDSGSRFFDDYVKTGLVQSN